MRGGFCFEEAFSRNIGFVTELEQQILRTKRVAIAGMGGVGGVHLLALARLGIGSFNLADPDAFELANFNRQVGAVVSTIGRNKLEVMSETLRDINPEAKVNAFSSGVTKENVDEFLSDCDVFVDGLDAFVPEARQLVFSRCHELGIPAITAGPVGMGAAYLIFSPEGMSFEQYYQMGELPFEHKILHFVLGTSPAALHRKYLVDPCRFNPAQKRAASIGATCFLCAGVVGVEVLKLLLNRGKCYAAPYYHLYDAYENKLIIKKLRWGLQGPFQRVKRVLGLKVITRMARQKEVESTRTKETAVERILDLARWTPSGDNRQPWRFLVDGEKRVSVTVRKERNVFAYRRGEVDYLHAGMLSESVRLAASLEGLRVRSEYQSTKMNKGMLKISFSKAKRKEIDPLVHFLPHRSTDRGRYRNMPLTSRQKKVLESTFDESLSIHWYESFAERAEIACFNARASDIRLRLPEAFASHQKIFDWKNRFSEDRIPGAAVPIDAITKQVMRWSLKKWERVDIANRYLGGTLLPQVEFDLIPGLSCAAHFLVELKREEGDESEEQELLLKAGAVMQRFWLTATSLGLVMQPGFSLIAMAHYGRTNPGFSSQPGVCEKVERLAQDFESYYQQTAKGNARRIVIAGRIGVPRRVKPLSRSTRLPLERLICSEEVDWDEDSLGEHASVGGATEEAAGPDNLGDCCVPRVSQEQQSLEY